MLSQLITSDSLYPLDVMSHPRMIQALKFDDSLHKIEVIEWMNQPEEYPPYYFKYRRNWLETSCELTQFAINDFMAMG